MVNFHIIIPARLHSSRLAEKLIKPLAGKPLLYHTYQRALDAYASSVTIATDHPQIAEVMTGFGARVLLTSPQHQTGTDRLAEAVNQLALADDAIIVNLQGDEPMMPALLIRQVAENLSQNASAAIATLCEPILNTADIVNPDIVKCVKDANGFALYFSRAPIPWDREHAKQPTLPDLTHYHRHLGIYAYRTHFLRAYQQLTAAPYEQLEKLEQLRALYYGYRIHVERAKAFCPAGVDTQADFDNIAKLFNNPN